MTALATVFWGVLALLVVVAALRRRARLREPLGVPPLLDDAAIQAIETTGSLELDDELDLAVIDEEGRRFWEDEEWE